MRKLLTYKDAFSYITNNLCSIYEVVECNAIAELTLRYILSVTKIDVLMNRVALLSENQQNQIVEVTARLCKGEPIQYVFGETEFFGNKFYVGEGVLIPRPETEELVDWIAVQHAEIEGDLLDVGCGSGAISVSLAKLMHKASVYALDISSKAIEFTRKNAILNKVNITVIQADILNLKNELLDLKFDLIVSNPPYVLESEKKEMHKNVLENEPHLALFVDDNNPLLFYNAIADYALNALSINGWLYFEINESLANEMTSLLQSKGFSSIIVRKDINGKDRMIAAQKNK